MHEELSTFLILIIGVQRGASVDVPLVEWPLFAMYVPGGREPLLSSPIGGLSAVDSSFVGRPGPDSGTQHLNSHCRLFMALRRRISWLSHVRRPSRVPTSQPMERCLSPEPPSSGRCVRRRVAASANASCHSRRRFTNAAAHSLPTRRDASPRRVSTAES